MNNLKLLRAIWEVRYPPAASFFDNRGRIAQAWYQRNGFEHWSISHNLVRLHSADGSKDLTVDHRRTVYQEDLRDDLLSFPKRAPVVTAVPLRFLKLRRLERIGFRVFLAAERESFDELRDIMANRIFAFDDSDWNAFGGKPLDIALPLTLSLGESKANFRIGPVKKEELLRDVEAKDMKKDELPEVAILLDFDVYQTSPLFSSSSMKTDFLAFLESSWKQIESISESIMNHFGGFLSNE